MAAASIPSTSGMLETSTKNTEENIRPPTVEELLIQIENHLYNSSEHRASLLIAVWSCIGGGIGYFRNIDKIFQMLYRESALMIFSGHWPNINIYFKRGLARALIQYSHSMGHYVKGSEGLCSALVMAAYDPWGDAVFRQLLKKEEVDQSLVKDFIKSEPPDLLLIRIECLVKSHHEEAAIQLLQCCLHSTAAPSTEESCDDEEWKWAFLEWLLRLLFRKRRLNDLVAESSSYSCHDGVRLIYRTFNSQIEDSDTLTGTLINLFLVRDLLFGSNYCCTSELMKLWCEFQSKKQNSATEIQDAACKLLVGHASSSAQFYLFVDILWAKFGISLLPLYLELYIRGLTSDLNFLEAARQADNKEYVIEIENHMAAMYFKLFSLFNNINKEIAMECLLSSFSLDPTKERLEWIRKLSLQIAKDKALKSASTNEDSKHKLCNRSSSHNCVHSTPLKRKTVVMCDQAIQVGDESFTDETPSTINVTNQENCDQRQEPINETKEKIEQNNFNPSDVNQDNDMYVEVIDDDTENECAHSAKDLDSDAPIKIPTADCGEEKMVNDAEDAIVVKASKDNAMLVNGNKQCVFLDEDENLTNRENNLNSTIDLGYNHISENSSSNLNQAETCNLEHLNHKPDKENFTNPVDVLTKDSDNTNTVDAVSQMECPNGLLDEDELTLMKDTEAMKDTSIFRQEGANVYVNGYAEIENETEQICENSILVNGNHATKDEIKSVTEELKSVVEVKECSFQNLESSKNDRSVTFKNDDINTKLISQDNSIENDNRSTPVLEAINLPDESNSHLNENKCRVTRQSEAMKNVTIASFSHIIIDSKIMGISPEVVSDFVIVLESLRNKQLKSSCKWSQVKHLCESYLEDVTQLRCMMLNMQVNESVDSEADSISELTANRLKDFDYHQSNDSVVEDRHADKTHVFKRFLNADKGANMATYVNLSDIHCPQIPLEKLFCTDLSSSHIGHKKRHKKHRNHDKSADKLVLKKFRHGSREERELIKRKKRKKRKAKKGKGHTKKHRFSHGKVTKVYAKNKKKKYKLKKKKEGNSGFISGDYCSDFSSEELMRLVKEHSNSYSKMPAATSKHPRTSALVVRSASSSDLSEEPQRKKRKVSFGKKHNRNDKYRNKHKHAKSKSGKRQKTLVVEKCKSSMKKVIKDNPMHSNLDAVKDYSHIVQYSSVKKMEAVQIHQRSVALDLSKGDKKTKSMQPAMNSHEQNPQLQQFVQKNFEGYSPEDIIKMQMLISGQQPSVTSMSKTASTSNNQSVVKYVCSKTTSRLLSVAQAGVLGTDSSDNSKSPLPSFTEKSTKERTVYHQPHNVSENVKHFIVESGNNPCKTTLSGTTLIPASFASNVLGSNLNYSSTATPQVTTFTIPLGPNQLGGKLIGNKIVIPLPPCSQGRSTTTTSMALVPATTSTFTSLCGNQPSPNVIIVKNGNTTQIIHNPQQSNIVAGTKILPFAKNRTINPIVTKTVPKIIKNAKRLIQPVNKRSLVKTSYSKPITKGPTDFTVTKGVASILRNSATPSAQAQKIDEVNKKLELTPEALLVQRAIEEAKRAIAESTTEKEKSVDQKRSSKVKKEVTEEKKTINATPTTERIVVSTLVENEAPPLQANSLKSTTEPIGSTTEPIVASTSIENQEPSLQSYSIKSADESTVVCTPVENQELSPQTISMQFTTEPLVESTSVENEIPCKQSSSDIPEIKEVYVGKINLECTRESTPPITKEDVIESDKVVEELLKTDKSDLINDSVIKISSLTEADAKTILLPSAEMESVEDRIEEPTLISPMVEMEKEESIESDIQSSGKSPILEEVKVSSLDVNSEPIIRESKTPEATIETEILTTISTETKSSPLSAATAKNTIATSQRNELQPINEASVDSNLKSSKEIVSTTKTDGATGSEAPTRSFTSISDAVRFSLMDMDDGTDSVENQVLEAFQVSHESSANSPRYDNDNNSTNEVDTNVSSPTAVTLITSQSTSTTDLNTNQVSQRFNSSVLSSRTEKFTECQGSVPRTWMLEDSLNEVSQATGVHRSSEADSAGEVRDDDRPKKKKKRKERSERDLETLQKFWCEICHKGFFSAYNLRRHCRNVHKMNLPRGSSDPPFGPKSTAEISFANTPQCHTPNQQSENTPSEASPSRLPFVQQSCVSPKGAEFLLQSPTRENKVSEFSMKISPNQHVSQIQSSEFQTPPRMSSQPSSTHTTTSTVTTTNDFRLPTSTTASPVQHSPTKASPANKPTTSPKFQRLPTSCSTTAIPQLNKVSPVSLCGQPSIQQQAQLNQLQSSGLVQSLSGVACQAQQLQQAAQCAHFQANKQMLQQRIGQLQLMHHGGQMLPVQHTPHGMSKQTPVQQFKKCTATQQTAKMTETEQLQQAAQLAQTQQILANQHLQKLMHMRQNAIVASGTSPQLSLGTAVAGVQVSPGKGTAQCFQSQLAAARQATAAAQLSTQQSQGSTYGLTSHGTTGHQFFSPMQQSQDQANCPHSFTAQSAIDFSPGVPSYPTIRLSSEANDGLEDLEQFLLENMPWSGDQSVSHNIVSQSGNRPSSADSLTLAIPSVPGSSQNRTGTQSKTKTSVTKPKPRKPVVTSCSKNLLGNLGRGVKKKPPKKTLKTTGTECVGSKSDVFSQTGQQQAHMLNLMERQCDKGTPNELISSKPKGNLSSVNETDSSDSVQCINVTPNLLSKNMQIGINFSTFPTVDKTLNTVCNAIPVNSNLFKNSFLDQCNLASKSCSNLGDSKISSNVDSLHTGSPFALPVKDSTCSSNVAFCHNTGLPCVKQSETSQGVFLGQQDTEKCVSVSNVTSSDFNPIQSLNTSQAVDSSLRYESNASVSEIQNNPFLDGKTANTNNSAVSVNSKSVVNLSVFNESHNKSGDVNKIENNTSSVNINDVASSTTSSGVKRISVNVKDKVKNHFGNTIDLISDSVNTGTNSMQLCPESDNSSTASLNISKDTGVDKVNMNYTLNTLKYTVGSDNFQGAINEIGEKDLQSGVEDSVKNKDINFNDVSSEESIYKSALVFPDLNYNENLNNECVDGKLKSSYDEDQKQQLPKANEIPDTFGGAISKVKQNLPIESHSKENGKENGFQICDKNLMMPNYSSQVEISKMCSKLRPEFQDPLKGNKAGNNSIKKYITNSSIDKKKVKNDSQKKKMSQIKKSELENGTRKPPPLKSGLISNIHNRTLLNGNKNGENTNGMIPPCFEKNNSQMSDETQENSVLCIDPKHATAPVQISPGKLRLRHTPKTSVKRVCPCCMDSKVTKKCRDNNSIINLFGAKVQNNTNKTKNGLKTKPRKNTKVNTRSSQRLRSRSNAIS